MYAHNLLSRWSKEENWPLTDQLLTLIEDNPTWKVALGFDKGDATNVKNGGKKLVDHYDDIVKKLWPGEDDQEKNLRDAIKNRVATYVSIT